MTLEVLIHKADGRLVSDDLQLELGAKYKVVKEDVDWGSGYIGCVGTITEEVINYIRNRRSSREARVKRGRLREDQIIENSFLFASWVHPDMGDLGITRFYRKSLERIA